MNANEYRKWIEAGLKDYGNDPWFFIRELAQNSRDAGAQKIFIKADHTPEKNEILIFEDDGLGMSFNHAVKYLFRLYASSKAKEKYAAGRFGIGFWTVLKFNPTKIIIESCFKKEKWGVEIDTSLNAAQISTDLTRGVRITLIRPAEEKNRTAFLYHIEESLNRYCSYLRKINRNASLLPVFFEGKIISGPMKLPGPVTLSFKNRFAEGVVGLGPQPQVNLYARGLPVWQGASLEELSHTPPSQKPGSYTDTSKSAKMAMGLAPVYLVNGNILDVSISRRKVIDNRALQRVKETAEDALSKLVEIAADMISPRNFFFRSWRQFRKNASNIIRSPWKLILALLIILLPLEYVLIKSFFKNKPDPVRPAIISLQKENNRYTGGSVKTAGQRLKVDLTYQPPVSTWFKLYHVETYRQASGFTQDFQLLSTAFLSATPAVDCGRKTIIVSFNTHEKGQLLLPRPLFYYIDPYSITINGILLNPVKYDAHSSGGILIDVPYSGVLHYRCCPPVEQPESDVLSIETLKRTTELPSTLFMPESINRELMNSLNGTTAQKIHTAIELTKRFIKYSDSIEIAKKYDNTFSLFQPNDWLQKVIRIGAGDCDVLNGAAVVFLRCMAVPARLVVGLTGENGQVLPGMHAWAEYFDNGWQILDVTAYASVDPGALTSPTLPPEPLNPPSPAIPGNKFTNSSSQTPQTSRSPLIDRGFKSIFYNKVFFTILSFLFLSSLCFLLLKS
ncbi:MAG: ATP-binding protein, partial [Acidobacteria bacterium]|nr:ATP-binding protein [Acidobacteriota bacterium]